MSFLVVMVIFSFVHSHATADLQVEADNCPSSALLADCSLIVRDARREKSRPVRVVVEGPAWFCSNRTRQLLGTGLLRRRRLQSTDQNTLVCIPYYELDALLEQGGVDSGDQLQTLLHKYGSHGVPLRATERG